MDGAGIVTLDVQPVLTPAAPPAGSFAAVGVTTDGANIVSLDYTSTPPHELQVDGIAMRFTKRVFFEDVVDFDTVFVKELTAGGGAGVPITISSVPAGTVGLDITGAGDAAAVTVDGAGHTAAALTNNDGLNCTLEVEQLGVGCAVEAVSNGAVKATISAENVVSGPAGNFTSSGVPATATFTNTGAGPSLEVVGDAKVTTVVNAAVGYEGAAGGNPALFPEGATVAAGKTLDGGAGSTCGPFSTIQGSTVDTGGSGGIVKSGVLQMYVDATPSTADGDVQYDGLAWHLGGDSVARPFYAPAVEYVPTDQTINTVEPIAGLTVTLEIPPTREVLIELFANQEVDTATRVPKLEVSASNAGAVDVVTRLKNGSPDQAISPLPQTVTGGDRRPNRLAIVWRPDDDVPAPANNTWTIQGAHGVTGGATLDSYQCTLRVTYR
jgi:hypothetical protein